MRFRFVSPSALLAATAALFVLAVPVRAQVVTGYSGSATGLIVTESFPVPSTQVFSQAGPLPSGGGSDSDSLAEAEAFPLDSEITTGPLTTSTSGVGGVVNSIATTNDLSASIFLTFSLTADQVQASASASAFGVSGSSLITGLVIDGTPITVTGAPNQTLDLGGGRSLIINEQIFTTSPALDGLLVRPAATQTLTVNALRFSSIFGATVIVSQASAGVTFTPAATDIPEPGTLALLLVGTLTTGAGVLRRRRA